VYFTVSSNSFSFEETRLSYNEILCGLIISFVVFLFLSSISSFEGSYAVEGSLSKKPFVLVNTTHISNCSWVPSNTSVSSLERDGEYVISAVLEKRGDSIVGDNKDGERCPYFKILVVDPCPEFLKNGSDILCTANTVDKKNKLSVDNFDENGLLIADTKFNQIYSYEMSDPVNPQKNLKIIMDFQKHNQTQNSDINSPRLKIARENGDGSADMSSAKNQEVVWTGNIKGFFEEPVGKYKSETYVVLQFNTGRHGSNESDEERGFGVLYDASNQSNPNLFEYLVNGSYAKYDFNQMKQLGGGDFVFHNLDENNNPKFINNLTYKENVKLKVKTFLINDTKRVIETFIDDGSGTEVPYWTIKDLSKLKDHSGVKDKDGYMETITQGSGYVIARTDNIDTRPSSFQSLAF
ncbi:MAG: hypothetical protein M3M88_02320, partial [Thermoproteota archaeon]|nr:hypothetical protein [Thermoproteota archaeon]